MTWRRIRAFLLLLVLVTLFPRCTLAQYNDHVLIESSSSHNNDTLASDFQQRWMLVEQDLQQKWLDLERHLLVHKQQMENDLENLRISWQDKQNQLTQEWTAHQNHMRSDLHQLQRILETERRQAERAVQRQFRRLRIELETHIFRQRPGILRVYKSLQNFLGVLSGMALAFFSSLLPHVCERWSRGLHTSVLARRGLIQLQNRSSNPRMIMLDVISASIVAVVVSCMPPRQLLLNHYLAPMTLSVALWESIWGILEKWNEAEHTAADEKTMTTKQQESSSPPASWMTSTRSKALSATGVLLTVHLITQFTPSWLPTILATSLVGSSLILESVADEIVGNWMRMIRHVGPERLHLHQRIYNGMCRMLEKHVLHPAQEALQELEMMALQSDGQDDKEQDVSSKDDRLNVGQRIQAAVAKNFRLRLLWSLAGVGMVTQLITAAIFSQHRKDWSQSDSN